jgi:hypothetical protein
VGTEAPRHEGEGGGTVNGWGPTRPKGRRPARASLALPEFLAKQGTMSQKRGVPCSVLRMGSRAETSCVPASTPNVRSLNRFLRALCSTVP